MFPARVRRRGALRRDREKAAAPGAASRRPAEGCFVAGFRGWEGEVKRSLEQEVFVVSWLDLGTLCEALEFPLDHKQLELLQRGKQQARG